MEIPNLGLVTKDEGLGWYYGQPMVVPVLGGKMCRLVVEGYDEDPNKGDFHDAIANFLSISPAVLKESEEYVFQYFKQCQQLGDRGDAEISIAYPSLVWLHVRLGSEPIVTRRGYGDKGIYVSLECGCDWEEEHGLQIVFKNGLKVNKVGPFDGHLTNSDAFADPSLENVIYRLF